jgi:PAS domain S-box-containing protein
MAIRSGEIIYVQDFATDPRLALWREDALQRGYRSTVALPLKDENANTFGGLFIYASEPNAITPDEIRLLEELAGDLAFGIVTLRTRAERKRAEEALRKKTEELDRYFTNALDLLCIADTDGYFRRLNPEWESTLGFSISELEGHRFLDFVHPDDLEATLQAVSQLAEQKEVLNFTNRYRCKSGAYRWIEWRSFPRETDIYAVARDITDRKRVEKELQRNRETAVQFSEQLSALQQVTIQLSEAESSDDLCRRAVELARSHLGFDRVGIWFIEEDCGCLRGSFGIDEQGRLRDERNLRAEFRQGGLGWQVFSQKHPVAYSEHTTLVHQGQELGEGNLAASALWDGDQVIGLIYSDNLISHQPITERQLEILRLYATTLGHLLKRNWAEEELRNHRDHLEELIQERTAELETALQETKNLLASAWAILSANSLENICENLILNFNQLIGADRTCLFLVDYTRREILLNMVRGSIDGEIPITYDELEDGIFGIVLRERRPVLSVHPEDGIEPEATKERRYGDDAGPLIVCPLMTKGEIIGHFVAINRFGQRVFTQHDMDLLMNLATQAAAAIENLSLFEAMQQATVKAEAANKELEAFAYSVSHDLRAPLRHIDGFLELLKKSLKAALDERSQHYMDTISDSSKRMGTLIDDLLSFSRMGRYELSKRPVDLGALVHEIVRELEPETRGRAVNWHIAELPAVTGDRAMLRLVLVNLISNALKFTSPRPQADIEIGWRPGRGTETVVFVRDNGVGFDMAYADKLFGVFQRLHRPDEFEGTGIGLANVRRIIHRHGGRTWAEGQLDQGATFYFSLPQTFREG